ncbi:MAG: F0F1 ATP synthase subunit epsilon [Prevotellaceae bacterium]|jgi:F-type H+-transporting ATPase subunit epsilon|nr:F0F1 ATP synthase subunit epsilon [Prevotellaceae bacterium]
MKLVVVTPEQTYTVDGIDSISIPGSAGRFEVLQGHAPLISTMVKGAVNYRLGSEEKEITVSGGVVKVENDEVSLIVENVEKL